MSNYEAATRELRASYVQEAQMVRANAFATLALVDEIRAGREPVVKEVFVLQKYNPLTDTESGIVDVYKDRTVAYTERDALNDTAFATGAPVRYVIKEKSVK